MLSKKAILTELANLTQSKLNKLHDYSKVVQMLYPEDDLLLNANMSQMLSKARELANTHLPSWTDRGDGDFGQFLVELVCLFSEKDYWYNNAFSLESNLHTSQVYSNAFVRAISMGYDPQVYTAGKVEFSVTFDGLDVVDVSNPFKTYNPGDLILKVSSGPDNYINNSAFQIPDSLSDTTQVIPMVRGKFKTRSYVFDGDRIFIEDSSIDPKTIRLYIDSVEWESVQQLGISDSFDKHFVALPEENGSATIVFGYGVFGKKVEPETDVFVTYIKTDGLNGKGLQSESFDIFRFNQSRPAISATPNSDETEEALVAETLESIKKVAPVESRRRKTIINTEDCTDFLLSKSSIARTHAVFINETITIYGINNQGISMVSAELDPFIPEIEAIMVQLGYTVIASDTNEIVLPKMDIVVETNPSANFNSIYSKVSQRIVDFFDPLVFGDYGRDFSHDDFYIYLKDSDDDIARINIYNFGTNVQVPDFIRIGESDIIKKSVVDPSNAKQTMNLVVKPI